MISIFYRRFADILLESVKTIHCFVFNVMHTHVKNIAIAKGLVLALSALLTVLATSCRAHNGGGDTRFVPANDTEEFHADNDIAMTIRSLADAIKVGEPLDSTLYNFEGVLTDGQGTPLYTDVEGAPGIWQINVLDNKNVRIRNLYLGDLLPGDLQSYLVQSLRLNDSQPFMLVDKAATDEDENEIIIYDFGGGYLCFEVKSVMAPNGLEGPLLSIVMTADRPDGV